VLAVLDAKGAKVAAAVRTQTAAVAAGRMAWHLSWSDGVVSVDVSARAVVDGPIGASEGRLPVLACHAMPAVHSNGPDASPGVVRQLACSRARGMGGTTCRH
jgi:hypothetical protein